MQSLNRVHRATAEPLPAAAERAYNVAEAPLAALAERFARLVAPLGWHLQFFADAATLVALEGVLARAGLEQPGFQALLRLLRSGRAWAKLAGADRITRTTGRLRDAIPFIQALAAVAPQRLLWGSDWPNIGFHSGGQVNDGAILPHRELDAGELLDLLAEAVPEVQTRRAILVRNPEHLYGFG